MQPEKKGKRLTLAISLPAVLILVLATVFVWDFLLEKWYLSKLDASDVDAQREAVEWLSGSASARAIPGLLELLARQPSDENYAAVLELCSTHRDRLARVKSKISRVPEIFTEQGFLEESLLYKSLVRGHHEMAELLLALGADLESPNSSSWTLLHSAATDGKLEAVQFLLANGARVSARTSSGQTPLHAASRWGHDEVVQQLIAKGADVHARNSLGWTPLHLAAYRGRLEVARSLLAHGADPNGHGAAAGEPHPMFPDTPLHWAANHGYEKVVELLVKGGADVDARGVEGETPLHSAVQAFCIHGIETWNARGAERRGFTGGGSSDSTIPSGKGHEQIIRTLISSGADINARNEEGRTPREEAVANRHPQFVDLLEKGGADAGARDGR